MAEAERHLRCSGGSSNLSNTLNSFKANATFVWDHTYSIGFGYFNVTGSSDCNLYGSPVRAYACRNRPGASATARSTSPNGNGLILDLSYLPFTHGAPGPYDYKTWNARIGVQFTELSASLRRHEQFRRVVPRRHAQRVGQQFGVRSMRGGVLTAWDRTRSGRVEAMIGAEDTAGARSTRSRGGTCPRRRCKQAARPAHGTGRGSLMRRVRARRARALSAAPAFAPKIPIQASLTGGGEVPPNASTARGRMVGTFDTDTNTLEWTVTYRVSPRAPIGAHFHGPVSYLGLTPEENAPIQVGTPGNLASPFHGVARSTPRRPRTSRTAAGTSTCTRRISRTAKSADPSFVDEGVGSERRADALAPSPAAKAGGDPAAGKVIFQTICHKCHAALPYTGRIGVENLPHFLANPSATSRRRR